VDAAGGGQSRGSPSGQVRAKIEADPLDPAREEEALQLLLDRRVDGVIICSSRLDEARLIRAIKPHRSAVLINREVPKQLAGMVDVDYRLGTEAVVEHLLAIGRRRIAIASGPPTSHSGPKRQAGVAAAMARHGIDLVAQHVCKSMRNSQQRSSGFCPPADRQRHDLWRWVPRSEFCFNCRRCGGFPQLYRCVGPNVGQMFMVDD
jgi:hypothetical protein